MNYDDSIDDVIMTSNTAPEDFNEDRCAMCMLDDGNLVCCSNCPSVFHINCHIPPLPEELTDDVESWTCTLCSNILDCVPAIANGTDEKPPGGGLSPQERTLMERILLELYCEFDLSIPFREAVNPEMVDYYEKIREPMFLDVIRERLHRVSENPYMTITDFIRDIRLIFKNAYIYHEESSPVYNKAKILEESFNRIFRIRLPVHARNESLAEEEGNSLG